MKKWKVVVILITILLVIFIVRMIYLSEFKKVTLVKSSSDNGKYELIIQTVGLPDFPFGSAKGRLLLVGEDGIVNKYDFKVANDGCQLTEEQIMLSWSDNSVDVLLSGGEQQDELVKLFFSGKIETQEMTTHYGKETIETNLSESEGYIFIIQSVGWPDENGEQLCRFTLKTDNYGLVCERDMMINNGSLKLTKENFSTLWNDDNVSVIVSGSNQQDELVKLFFDGSVTSEMI